MLKILLGPFLQAANCRGDVIRFDRLLLTSGAPTRVCVCVCVLLVYCELRLPPQCSQETQSVLVFAERIHQEENCSISI